MIAAAKITLPLMAQTVIERCLQIHGAGSFSADYFMAEAFSDTRGYRQADGPDQVHMMARGKPIIQHYAGPAKTCSSRYLPGLGRPEQRFHGVRRG